jgi:hypothetical protein
MNTLQIFWTVLGGIILFSLGFCAGNIFEISKELRELNNEKFEIDRDLKSLEKMEKEHQGHMATLEEWEQKYKSAYDTAMKIINEKK